MAYSYANLVCWYQGIEDQFTTKKKENYFNWNEKISRAFQ